MKNRPWLRRRSLGSDKQSPGFEALEPRQYLTATPLITEFMAANDGSIVDQDSDHSDWIEVSNVGDTAVDLVGWHLTDDSHNLVKWTFPSTPLAPGTSIVVFASSKDRAVSGSELHTNFSLNASGEFLALFEPDGSTVATQYTPKYPEQRSNVSYGMRTDAGGVHPSDLRYFSPATPGAPNDEGYLGFVATPAFSIPHGFYSSVQNIGITSATGGSVIRYTFDGTTPTASTGSVYSAPLAVSHIAVLRAGAFASGYLPSTVETQTYLYTQDVTTQVRPTTGGYPTTWGNAPAFPELGIGAYPNVAADYDIDPEVVNDPAYTADFLDGLTSIPTVSVVMNADDLFATISATEGGIYSHPWLRGDAWDRATSFELINPDGSGGFQINAGISILGNASRMPQLNPKHSLQIDFKSQYGPSELDYPLFGTSAGSIDKFNSLVLRSNLSDSWVSPQGDAQVLTFVGTKGRSRAQYARDNYTRETQLAMGGIAPDSNYVHVYLNGLYWGLYDLSERRDDDFVAAHLGGDPTDYDVIQDNVFHVGGTNTEVVQGDMVAWDAMMALANSGLANTAQYQQIQQYLDIPKFIDYMNLHLYVGSQDWPYNNWSAARKREAGGTFQFFAWDAEYTLQDPTTDRTGVSDVNSPGQLFAALKNNADFRLSFADRANHFLFNGGLLTPGPAAARYLALVNQLTDPIVDESARWGDYRRDVLPIIAPPYELSTRDNQWTTEKARMLNSYFPVRTTNVINQYIAAGLYPSLAAATFNQQGGSVATGFQLTMSAPVGTIRYTVDGTDPRLSDGSVSGAALTYSGPVSLLQSTHINARVQNGSVWSALNTADFAAALPQVRITELMYHPPSPPPGGLDKDEFEFIEIQNIGSTTLNLQGMQLLTGVTYTFPTANNLAPGKFVVVYDNKTAFESRYGTGLNAVGPYSGKLSNSGEELLFKDAFGQQIQKFTFHDDWYPTTDGGGYSLVIRDPLAALTAWDTQAGWKASSGVQGSPSLADVTSVVGRQLFYNNSAFDNNSAAVNASDDSAIATDKTAYLPNATTALFANVSSYGKGINGILVDLLGAGSHAAITAADFVFKSGADNTPSGWSSAPGPLAISVRAGAGVSGSDRVEIIWGANAVKNQWLEVQVLATANTGLTAPDVFFWGNKLGDTGTPSATDFSTTLAGDGGLILAGLGAGTGITNVRDIDRSNSVTVAGDRGTTIANLGTLNRLTVGAGGPFAPVGSGAPAAAPAVSASSAVETSSTGDVGIASALAASPTSKSTLVQPARANLAAPLPGATPQSRAAARFFQELAETAPAKPGAPARQGDAVHLDEGLLDVLAADVTPSL